MGLVKSIKKRIRRLKEKRVLRRMEESGVPAVSFYFDKKTGIEQHKETIEYLVLGSSHGQAAVNTDRFPDYSAFNLSIASQDMYYSYELYKKYIPELPRLKTVFLFYSVFSSGAEMQKTVNHPLCHYYKNVFDIDFKYPLKTPYYGDIVDYFRKSAPEIPFEYTGFTPIVGTFNEEIAWREVYGHLKHAMRNNHQEEYVRKFYKTAKEHGHNLVVIISPHSPAYHEAMARIRRETPGAENIDFFKSLFEITDKYAIPVLNYFETHTPSPPPPVFTNEDFWDWEHLAPNGAEKFTGILLEKTKEMGL